MRLKSPLSLDEITANIGSMLLNNRDRYIDRNAFAQRQGDAYHHWTWQQMVGDVLNVAAFVLPAGELQEDTPDKRVAFISANCYHRLVAEMAVMGTGMVAVPVFAGYASDLMSDLVGFANVGCLVSDNLEKIASLRADCLPGRILAMTGSARTADPKVLEKLSGLGVSSVTFMDDLFAADTDQDTDKLESRMRAIKPDSLALIMFTSGTSSFPKGVQLTHRNLMSQQKALEILWKPEHGMRFLCYLPWHHSFGGLFERFFALHSGGCLAIDDSAGKDVGRLLQNFS
ncbi:MAG: AMP-binding protein, partial [Xanthomonadales bacterium]